LYDSLNEYAYFVSFIKVKKCVRIIPCFYSKNQIESNTNDNFFNQTCQNEKCHLENRHKKIKNLDGRTKGDTLKNLENHMKKKNKGEEVLLAQHRLFAFLD